MRVEYFCGVLGDLTGQRLLEIGCGGGLMAEEYARRGASLAAVDRSAASIAIAARHARASGLKIAYAPSVGERLPFTSGSFDAVVSADTLEHVDDVDLVVSESARVLRPGGVLAMSFDVCDSNHGVPMTFPASNGHAMTLAEFERDVWSHEAFGQFSPIAWNIADMAPFHEWHKATAPHHNYVVAAAVLTRTGQRSEPSR
ncbi:MAG: methyltransferase domain-containing protein [Planctomycetes bacterium]|nr:methyltransferase domain-containing protein [Planctomycetota bacterium]